MKMRRFEELFSRTLVLALAAILILSGMLGMNAQAAENKISLELPTAYLGEPTDKGYLEEIDNTLYAFLASGDAVEIFNKIEAYALQMEEDYGMELQASSEGNQLVCYMKKNGTLHAIIMWDATGNKVLVGYNNDTVKLVNNRSIQALETPTEHVINNISSTYITNGGEYTVAVGDALTLYHPRTPISTYYAYTWIPTEGSEHVMLDKDQATCQLVGLTEGTVVLECTLDESVNYYPGCYDHNTYVYTITIHVVGAEQSGENDYGTMTGKLCPRCHGAKEVEMSGATITCDVCNGTGLWP